MANDDRVMKETEVTVSEYLSTVSEKRQNESRLLIEMMREITGLPPVMWGPSIIGFGTVHYRYDSGREGDMPILAFSPRKAQITVYFSEGFDEYGEHLAKLGKHKTSVSCLYINKLQDVDTDVLKELLKASWKRYSQEEPKPKTVDEYIAQIPEDARERFDELREFMHRLLPDAKEVLSYGIVGFKVDTKRPRVYISGWKDHLGMYPMPKDPELARELKPYVHGKSSIWLSLDDPLPEDLIRRIVVELTK